MEQIYSIPVNEAFDRVRGGKECACPFCVLYNKLEEDELDIILGASMMEPDIRIKTNEQGFCDRHFARMLKRKRMLGLGLIMQSHLGEVSKLLEGPSVAINRRTASVSGVKELAADCYVCARIKHNLDAMIATAVYLYDTDSEFNKKFTEAPYFCLPHYAAMTEYASKKLPRAKFAAIFDDAKRVNTEYLKTLSGDVDWFCKKFDCRYDEEPWYNSKDSLPRAIKFLAGDMSSQD